MTQPTSAKSSEKATPSTVTDWSVFTKLRLNPKKLKCDGYKPTHGYDASCHTTLKPTLDSIKNHINGEHGGGFYLELESVPEGAKVWTGWDDLSLIGAEITDIRGAVKNNFINLTPIEVRQVMQTQSTQRGPQPGGGFYITISLPNAVSKPADEE